VTADEQYRSLIDAWIVEALNRQPGIAALTLLQALPCVYPTDLADALRRLGAVPTLSRASERLLHELGGPPLPAPDDIFRQLPVPHALDFEWRFDRSTVERLVHLVRANTEAGATVLLLGSPTVALLGPETLPDRTWLLVESNPLVIDRLRNRERLTVLQGDARSDWPDLPPSACVVTDPPWYEADLLNFLATATKSLEIGSSVIASLPPRGVRPGIQMQLDRIAGAARDYGLRQDAFQQADLSYEGPFFERNALAAAGLAGVPWNWRRGDLGVFVKVTAAPIAPPMAQTRADRPWDEVMLGQVRIKIDCSQHGAGDPGLIKVVPGDILPSVSRRSPWRTRAQVWTSGNRVFRTQNPAGLLETARSLADGRSPKAISDQTGIARHHVDKTIAELHDLVETEVTDMRKVSLVHEPTG